MGDFPEHIDIFTEISNGVVEIRVNRVAVDMCLNLLIKGGPVIGPHLGLIGNYLPGYTVSWQGAFVGLVEGVVRGSRARACVCLCLLSNRRRTRSVRVSGSRSG